MSRQRVMFTAGALAAIVACAKSPDAQPGSGDSAAIAAAINTPGEEQDPCRLVSQAEAEKWLGPLAHPPFRTDGGDPVPAGKKCKFVGQDGRYIVMEVDWTDGKIGMKAMSMMGGLTSMVFTDNSGKTDTLEGTWDEARWMGPGSFFALRNDVLVTTDVSAAKGGVEAAADLSSKALERVEHLLPYNGAAAAANAPKIRETGDACALLTAADIASISGELEGSPAPSGQGQSTGCLYHLKVDGNSTELSLEVSWRRGFEQFAGQKMVMKSVLDNTAGMQQAHGQTGAGTNAESTKTPAATTDKGMQQVLGVLKGLAKTQGIQMNDQGGLVQDTLIAGPWAEGAILGGISFIAVKNDVGVTMGFKQLSIDQAKALMAKVMEKI